MLSQIFGYLLIGLLAGWLASLIVRGRGLGLGGDIVVGIVGALIGGLVFDALNITTFGTFGSLVTAVVGAILLLLIVNALQGETRRGVDI
ncbi:GlsB/YeaQ/YmgE family stress response membrane protein [Candidatus Uhrbacteria bacterium]|nr:GlsB/YeaQ/YmgE family stress response membrane protein [Candidatus Uhrbacteria bacterium]